MLNCSFRNGEISSPMKTDGNGRKNSSLISVSIFLAETGLGSGKNEIKNGWGYTEIRKQTHTDGEPDK